MIMQKYIKLAINGGQILRRCQGMRRERDGGGQCNQAVEQGREYCRNHPARAIAELERDGFLDVGIPKKLGGFVFDNSPPVLSNVSVGSALQDVQPYAYAPSIERWKAIVVQFADQTSKKPVKRRGG